MYADRVHYLLRKTRRVKLILPALTEATSPYWRPIKYSLFPPLGLATLAAYLDPALDITLQDEHVEPLDLDDDPDLVIIQVYITNAYRAYRIADHYRRKGAHVALGGLHVTSLPEEAAPHADTIFLGPGEDTFPQFLRDLAAGTPQRRYQSSLRTLEDIPPIRRDLIKRHRYLVPNSIVVSRGCPHHCTFCYKDAFFEGGRSFYTQRVDDALAEIARLPGRHLYFLDDHLLGNRRFSRELFTGMRGMNRVFQGAATVDSILRDDTIELAARAGLRSIFVGFETLSTSGLQGAGKKQNLGRDYRAVIRRLDDLGIMINGSFVFGLDGDEPDVFERTVDWAVDERHHHRHVPHRHAVPGHAALFGDGRAEPNDDQQLGSLRHPPRRLPADRHHARGTQGRLRLGVPGVLSLGQHLHGRARASIVQTFTEASRLQRRLEEVRAGLGLRDSPQATVADAADARGGPFGRHAAGPNARNWRGLSIRIDFNVASGIPAFTSIGANTVTA